jgi:hypothetical protein
MNKRQDGLNLLNHFKLRYVPSPVAPGLTMSPTGVAGRGRHAVCANAVFRTKSAQTSKYSTSCC